LSVEIRDQLLVKREPIEIGALDAILFGVQAFKTPIANGGSFVQLLPNIDHFIEIHCFYIEIKCERSSSKDGRNDNAFRVKSQVLRNGVIGIWKAPEHTVMAITRSYVT
jgi:hypothetical protein